MHGHSICYMVLLFGYFVVVVFFHLSTIIQLLLLFGRLLLGLAYGLLALATLSLHVLALLLDARLEILQSLLQPMLVIATNAQRFKVLRVEREQSAALHIVLLEDGYIALQFDAHQPVADLQRRRRFRCIQWGNLCLNSPAPWSIRAQVHLCSCNRQQLLCDPRNWNWSRTSPVCDWVSNPARSSPRTCWWAMGDRWHGPIEVAADDAAVARALCRAGRAIVEQLV